MTVKTLATIDTTPVLAPAKRRWIAPPLRIAVVAPPFFPIPTEGYGGTERVVDALVHGLAGRGHDVTLFAAPGSKVPARVRTPLERPPLLGDPAAGIDELHHAAGAYARRHDFDIIHDHTGAGPVLAALLGDGPPVVHTLHGPWTPQSRRLAGLAGRRVNMVAISHAQQAGNPLAAYAGVVYNGIDLAAHPLRRAKDDFVVYLGRVCADKRPEVAIEVARRAGLPLVMLVKRTEPSEVRYWEDVVAPRLGGDVTVVDQPSHRVKVDYLSRAKALLFPINWPEPFGLVMAEAMACGTPVVGCPVGAAPEVVADGVTGYLRTTVRGMVQAVGRVDRLDPDECRARVEQRFSAGAMVSGYEEVYRAALARAGRPGRPALAGAAAR